MESSPTGPSKLIPWPPQRGQKVTFQTKDGVKEGVLREVLWGLVWRDFLLEDGRVAAEHNVVGCPEPPPWREPETVSAEERKAWERRLIVMAETGLDPHDREQLFWADLTQYVTYTYLRFKRVQEKPGEAA